MRKLSIYGVFFNSYEIKETILNHIMSHNGGGKAMLSADCLLFIYLKSNSFTSA